MLRVRFGVRCFLGLTATATMETVMHIGDHLMLKDYKQDTIKGTILPPNLNLSVSRDREREQVRLINLHVPLNSVIMSAMTDWFPVSSEL